MPTTIYLRRTINRPLTVTELDANFSNLQTAVDTKALSGLADVSITSVANGQLLQYNSTSARWENVTNLTLYGHLLSSTTSNRIGTIGGQDFLYGAFNSGGSVIGSHPNVSNSNGLTTVSSTPLKIWNANTTANSQVQILTGGNSASTNLRWYWTSAGHFLAGSDNAYDIGASSANRPRYGYFAADVVANAIYASAGVGAGQYFRFINPDNSNIRGYMESSSNGIFLFRDSTQTTFGRLQLGGTTTSYPAIKRNGVNIDFRLADDSAFTGVSAATATLTGAITMNGGSSLIDPTANLSATASNDLRITTTDVLALGGATIVVGGNTLTQANAHGHITVKTSGAGTIYMDSTNNIGVGVGFDNSNVPASTVHIKAGTATTRIESTSASVNTQLRIQDTFVAYGMGIRANELSIFQYPLTSSADNITVTGSELLLGFDTNKKMKLSTTIYGSSAGFMKMQANGVVTIDTSTYLTQNQSITLTGHVTGSGTTTIATTLATVGTAGTYSKVTTDAYGRVTSGANITASDVTTALTYTPVNKAGDTMSGALTLSANPTADYHAATKIYVDALAQGLSIKQSVRVATTANITLNNTTTTVDSVTLANGDRILVKNQTTGSQNGVYIVSTSGAWARATDFDTDADVVNGFFTFVKEGSTNADSGWVLTTNDTIVVGTTSLSFTQFSGAGQITAGTGLTKTGNTLSIANTGVAAQTYGTHGQIPQIVVNQQGQITSAQNIQSGYVTNIGDGSSLTYTITHNLGSRDVVVQMYDASTYEQVSPNINRATTNTISITGFLSAPSTNQYRVVITRVL
jgi:hypothetical protein